MVNGQGRFAWSSALILGALLAASAPAQAQQGAGVLIGQVADAFTRAPVADVVITVTSASLQGEQIVVSDANGNYRIPNLPPGEYAVRFEREAYRPVARPGVSLRADATLRIQSLLQPEAIQGEEVVVLAEPPSVDVGSTTTGLNVTSEFARMLPLGEPTSRGGAVRSFESIALVSPGARADLYGTSINGTTSPENQYVIDGLSVNNAAFGINGAPLSMEFVQDMNVITGGFMPEYGRSTGGVLNVVTKQGSNEFHGGAWAHSTPSFLEGTRTPVRRRGTAVDTQHSLGHVGDVGVELGGPIVRDRLWFYVGAQLAQSLYTLDRGVHATRLTQDGKPVLDSSGLEATDLVPGSRTRYSARGTDAQVFGKLTFSINARNRMILAMYALPSTSGGGGDYSLDTATGVPQVGFSPARPDGNISGTYEALGRKNVSSTYGGSLKWTTESESKRLLFDTTIGLMHQRDNQRAVDGTRAGSGSGLAALPMVEWRRNSPGFHPITDFEALPPGATCDAAGASAAASCPVQSYTTGGPGFLSEKSMTRYQAKSVATYLLDAAGQHVAKAGVEGELLEYDHLKADSGNRILREADDGSAFFEFRQFGFLRAPDTATILDALRSKTRSVTLGGFVQDSWSIVDYLTVNAGLRYDAQMMYASDGALAMALPNQWSPRAGIIADPSRNGHSKIYASYARYHESVPLNVIDRAASGDPNVFSAVDAGACNPRDPAQASGACRSDANRVTLGGPSSPDQKWLTYGAGKTPVDPRVQAQSTDELVLGGELDVMKKGRVGLFYTKRWMNRVIEDMSRDETNTFFIGNPGYGIASDFPKPVRDYDALTVFFQKGFSNDWLAQATYTLSSLRGNYAGLFRPETGQLDPNMNSDFDIKALTQNRTGPLPGDHTHAFKVYAARDIRLPGSAVTTLGGSFRGQSGGPTNYLGSHPLYGQDEVFVLPRGEGERLPWLFETDVHVGLGFRAHEQQSVTLTLDVFNLFNFQQTTATDQRYTSSDVNPLQGGTRGNLGSVTTMAGAPLEASALNPNFGRPAAYQPPRQFRLGVRATF